MKEKALVVLSGGQDSVTCLAWAANRFETVHSITFNYGQRHRVELDSADAAVQRLACDARFSRTRFVLPHFVSATQLQSVGRSALTAKDFPAVGVPHQDNAAVPASFVPGRNALFLTLAYVYAITLGAEAVVTGVCQTDFSGYPDCRRDFVDALQNALELGYLPPGKKRIPILTPLMYLDKAQTFALAEQENALETVLEVSHTCYEGDHTTSNEWGFGCGQCPACKLRARGYAAFRAGNYNRDLLAGGAK